MQLQPYIQALPTVPLKRLDINTGERYLGVRITLEGSWKDEYTHRLKEQHTMLANIITTSSMILRQQAYMIRSIHYKPGINYALQHTQFTSV